MPTHHRHHIITDRNKTIQLAIDELLELNDKQFIILRAHQIVDSVLFSWVARHVPNLQPLQDSELQFKQLALLSQAFLEADTQPWIWKFIMKLTHLRNESVHELYPKNDWNIDRLIEFARPFLHLEAEENQLIGLQKTLVMAILILQSVLSPAAKLGKSSPRRERESGRGIAMRLIATPN